MTKHTDTTAQGDTIDGGDDDAYERLPAEELATEIERISPEGRPADPMMSPRRIYYALAGAALLIVAAGAIVAVSFDRAIGVGAAIGGLALLAINPTVWSVALRARERRRAQRGVEAHHRDEA